MDGGAWKAAVHGVVKSRTRLSNFTFTFHFHALEKEMATHSGVLAWKIPGTGKPGGLPLWGHTELDTQSTYMVFTIHNKNIIFLPTAITIFIFTLIAWLEKYYFFKR